MLITEEQAKEMWCPYARTYDGCPPTETVAGCAASVNRGLSEPNAAALRCIGSACMAWRWGEFEEAGRKYRDREHIAIAREYVENGEIRRGYCGLAGEPK